jgi:hypothetical protein
MKPSPLRNVCLPVVKSRRPVLASRFCRSSRVFLCLAACSTLALVWCLFNIKPLHLETAQRPRGKEPYYTSDKSVSNLLPISIQGIVENADTIPSHSLTAVLPVTSVSLLDLHIVLQSFLRTPSQLAEIIVTCSDSVLDDAKRIIRQMVSALDGYRYPEFSLRPWVHGMDQSAAVLYIATSHVTTEWVLLLDEAGFGGLDSRTIVTLVAPTEIQIPYGPEGFVFSGSNVTRITPSPTPQAASFLVPPFVMPSTLLRKNVGSSMSNTWAALGSRISDARLDMVGGILMSSRTSNPRWDPIESEVSPLAAAGHFPTQDDRSQDSSSYISDKHSGVFAILLPSLQFLRLFSSVACHLRSDDHKVQLLIYHDNRGAGELLTSSNGSVALGGCHLYYDIIIREDGLLDVNIGRQRNLISDWMGSFDVFPDVVVTIAENDWVTSELSLFLDEADHQVSLVRIPEADLPYCYWMSSLSLKEWKSERLLFPWQSVSCG